MKKYLPTIIVWMLMTMQMSVAQIVGNANDFLEIGGFAASQSLGNADGAHISGAEAGFAIPPGCLWTAVNGILPLCTIVIWAAWRRKIWWRRRVRPTR